MPLKELFDKKYLYENLWLGAVRPLLEKYVKSTDNTLDDTVLKGLDMLADHFLKPEVKEAQ